MKVYLAARYSRYPEMQAVAVDLARMGHEVTSRWIAGVTRLDAAGRSIQQPTERRAELAGEALEDVLAADAIIAFTEEPRSDGRGVRHVEFGVAIATGKRLIVVGPRENVFHCFSKVAIYPTWEACRGALHYEDLEAAIGAAGGSTK